MFWWLDIITPMFQPTDWLIVVPLCHLPSYNVHGNCARTHVQLHRNFPSNALELKGFCCGEDFSGPSEIRNELSLLNPVSISLDPKNCKIQLSAYRLPCDASSESEPSAPAIASN